MKDILTDEQNSALRSLHFWRRNLLVARKWEDKEEVKKSKDAIEYVFEKCDRLKISFRLQNRVLHASENNIAFYDIRF